MSSTAYSIAEVAKMINGKTFFCNEEAVIQSLLIDSRKSYISNETLFFAIEGERHNGHHYIKNLQDKGIKNFVISDASYISDDANFILVNNTLEALQSLAKNHREKFDCPIIGITGSNGKTIVKEWLYQLLKDHIHITRSPKSYNSQVGVPLSIWFMNEDTELSIFEAGISELNEMKQLQAMITPSIGIFTNIGAAHDDGFRDQKEKALEKSILFKDTDQIIYCKDHTVIHEALNTNFENDRLFSWSLQDKNSSVYVNKIITEHNISIVDFIYNNNTFSYKIPFIDKASIENSIHCICALILLDHLNSNTLDQTKKLSPVSMRLELKDGINNCTIINDTYNSDINSLQVALDFLNQQHGKKTLILSDITSSQDNNELYKEIAKVVNSYPLYQLIGIGKELDKHKKFFNVNKKQFYNTTDELLASIKYDSFHSEAILLKGSRDFTFEKIAKQIELKVHKTRLEIDLNAMVNNLNYYKSITKKGTKFMAMVKAFSYGSGSIEIANLLEFNRIDYLAVAYTDEGVELRKNGIQIPIMVMNPDYNSFDNIIKYQLEPEIYSFSILGQFISTLERNFNNTQAFPIHIKLDSGMHRLGFMPNEVSQLSHVLNSCKSSIRVASVFSHLAASDNAEQKDFTEKQITTFNTFCKQLESNLNQKFLKHILNSGGIENFPNAQYDMVRLGIGLYGISSNENAKKYLVPVSTLKSTISQIKIIDEGETVGYNRKAMIDKPTKIAIVAIGYADGINRNLGNGNYSFIVKGQKAKTVGDICMDMCMIDVTQIDCQVGDEVIIFSSELPVELMASKLNSIPYEVLTSISQRVKRIYYQE